MTQGFHTPLPTEASVGLTFLQRPAMAVVQSPLLLKLSVLSHEATRSSLCRNQQMPQVTVVHPHLKIERPSTSSSLHSSFCVPALRSRRSTPVSSVSCRAAAQEAADDGTSSSSDSGDGGGFEVDKALDRVLQSDESAKLLDSLAGKVLQDEDSKALLKEFATAAERVAKAKQELESIDKRERDLADIVSKIVNQAVDEETEIASLVAESERAVLAAEEEVKAAELALVTARAGGSEDNLRRKWESYDIDEDQERIESGKAAALSVLAGTIASIPFYLTGDELRIGSLLSIGGVVVSSALFGVTYRYILRRDLGNFQLKSGAAAAFSLVRGIGQVDAIQVQVGFPAQGGDEVILAALSAVQGFFIFGFSALALDYCLRESLLSPFPSKKSDPH